MKVYQWLTHSDLTREMPGSPFFPDSPIPTWDAFDKDYVDYYFDGAHPLKGQCFIIIIEGQEIGQINYNAIDTTTRSTEIDIWLAERNYTGRGLGTEAIKILCSYLESQYSCDTIYIAPSRRNIVAIKAYKKAAFIEMNHPPANFVAEYEDTVRLVKTKLN